MFFVLLLVLMYNLMLSQRCLHCMWQFRQPTADFDFVFLLVTMRRYTARVSGRLASVGWPKISLMLWLCTPPRTCILVLIG